MAKTRIAHITTTLSITTNNHTNEVVSHLYAALYLGAANITIHHFTLTACSFSAPTVRELDQIAMQVQSRPAFDAANNQAAAGYLAKFGLALGDHDPQGNPLYLLYTTYDRA